MWIFFINLRSAVKFFTNRAKLTLWLYGRQFWFRKKTLWVKESWRRKEGFTFSLGMSHAQKHKAWQRSSGFIKSYADLTRGCRFSTLLTRLMNMNFSSMYYKHGMPWQLIWLIWMAQCFGWENSTLSCLKPDVNQSPNILIPSSQKIYKSVLINCPF